MMIVFYSNYSNYSDKEYSDCFEMMKHFFFVNARALTHTGGTKYQEQIMCYK